MQPIFDGHNDALLRAGAIELMAGRPDGHLDVPRARAGGLAGGIFAVFTPSPRGHEPVDYGAAAAHSLRHAGRLLELERLGGVRIVRSVADLDRCAQDGVLGAVLHLEGAEAIDPALEALGIWHAAGLRSLGPVWSRPNAFGHGVQFVAPSGPDIGPGLTAAGEALVRRCAELGILVDLSHLNEAGFWDVARLEPGSLVASHSGAHALAASSRNLTDAQLDAIGASGGLVGIVFACAFLRSDFANEADTPLELIVAHARYVAERIGVEHVALGSDFDGATVPAALGDVAGLPTLLAALADGGFTGDEVAAIAWANWRRTLAAWWG